MSAHNGKLYLAVTTPPIAMRARMYSGDQSNNAVHAILLSSFVSF